MVDGSCAGSKILVVEDEPDIRELVRYNLEQEGFRVVEAADGERALALVLQEKPALLMLDLMLPGMDGLRLCRMLRERAETADIPIVMLTARAAEIDRVLGLEMGADDYVTKPFSPRELVARVRAVLRRTAAVTAPPPPDRYERGRLRMDFGTYEAWLDGRPLGLSLREFELLKFFVRNPQRVFDRLGILDLVWGQDTYVEPRTVDVHVRRLRVQVERDPAHPELILTVRGVGYKFDDRALEAQRQTE
jgi:two-component system, OmpR family, alkaline phosphatase synthesis response regulator PhoP